MGSSDARIILTDDRFEVRVPTPDDGHVFVDVRQRRADVVARLLALGVTRRTLITLLPEWAELITEVHRSNAPTA